HALAVELGESQFDEENLSPIEDMVSVCAGLVTVDEESAIIRLVHHTTQEYFERTQKRWFPDAETDLATERLQSNPLYDYASHNWGHHARDASSLIPEVISFLDAKAQAEASSQVLLVWKAYSSDSGYSGYSQSFARQMTGLHLAAYFGLKNAVDSSLQIGLAAHLKDSSDRTPLSWAAWIGHEGVVKLLLDKMAEVDAKDSSGQTPLSIAAGNGREVVVKLLLEKGAEVDTKDSNSRTPLSIAAGNGREVVVQLLLDKMADVDTKDGSGLTPMSWAAEKGHEVVEQLLLRRGALLRKRQHSESDTFAHTELQEKVLGKEHPDILKNMGNLGVVLKKQGKYDEAERMCQQAAQLAEKVLGRNHPDTIKYRDNLAMLVEDLEWSDDSTHSSDIA
ncbi:hypothetical protein V502_01790, partial [Pseudogymnoascus sp. VKM F-4520 (FW-2644)]